MITRQSDFRHYKELYKLRVSIVRYSIVGLTRTQHLRSNVGIAVLIEELVGMMMDGFVLSDAMAECEIRIVVSIVCQSWEKIARDVGVTTEREDFQ